MSTQKRVVINALGVCVGGGKTLLLDLINSVQNSAHTTYTFWLDDRLPNDIKSSDTKLIFEKASGPSRLVAEERLYRSLTSDDLLLCLNNVPPLTLYKPKCKVAVFIQNRTLLEAVSDQNLSLKGKLRVWLSQFWIRFRAKSISAFFVQTPTMSQKVPSRGRPVIVCASAPQLKADTSKTLSKRPPQSTTFFYPAAPYPHKNHKALIAAWKSLSSSEDSPKLILTVNQEDFEDQNLPSNIECVGDLGKNALLNTYKDSDALIFPSACESFGLPLIEAIQLGIPVVASDLDFVHDICTPSLTFNPEAPESIAKAVTSFIEQRDNIPKSTLATHIGTSKEFIDSVQRYLEQIT